MSGGQGSFADLVVVAADKAVPIPDGVDDITAAALLMQGITAQYLVTDTYPVNRGDTALIHACPSRAIELRTLWKACDEITAILVAGLKTAKADEERERQQTHSRNSVRRRRD